MPQATTSPRYPDRKLRRGIILLCIAALAALTTLRGSSLLWRREQALQAGEERAANLALILAAYLREAFAAVDTSLRNLAVLSPRLGGPGGPPEQWSPILESLRSSLPAVGSLSILDADGVIRHSTVDLVVGQSRQDEYLVRLLTSEGTSSMVASTPFRSLIDPSLILIPVGRPLHTPEAQFAGTVVATVVPRRLRAFFQAVHAGEGGAVWVFHPDGLTLFREPSDADPIGEQARQNPIFAAAVTATGSGIVRGPVEPRGPALISAFQRVETPPLLLAVSLAEAPLLAAWRREVTASAAAFLLLAALLVLGLRLLFREMDARNAAEQVRRSRRLEAIGHLTGGVAHDFNNLLTVILGHVDLLRQRASEDSDSADQALQEIRRAAERAADLTRRLLVFARRQPLQPRVIDLNELVTELQPLLRPLLREDIQLDLRLSPTPCLAALDPPAAENALTNLCSNARDAMPCGGALIVATRSVTLDQVYARRHPYVQPGPYTLVTVSDTGVGIPREAMERIFEPYFTTKQPGRGTGLGLSLVHGFVKQSGGTVEVYSEVGHGTTVKLYFPEVAGAPTPVRPATPTVVAAAGRGETLLVVEDEAPLRRLAGVILRSLGYRVVLAPDAAAALAAARQEPRIDLLFTDVVLPKGVGGRELAEQLAGERGGVKVLYTSGYSADIIERRGQMGPALRLLTKPYTTAELAAAVAAALRDPDVLGGQAHESA